MNPTPERLLARAAGAVSWQAVPADVRGSIRDLFVDWLASAVAGAPSGQPQALERVTEGFMSGGTGAESSGAATRLTDFSAAPPLVASLINGAAGHVVEMDDLHNASIYHPGACVFPAALALAEARGASGSEFLAASLAGYEVSLRVGEALGPEHYVFFHTTGTAGTLGACAAAAHLLGLEEEAALWAMGNAASQAAGLWEFLADGAMTKQLHTAKAAFNGMLAALLAEEGFTGPVEGLLGDRALIPATTAAGALRLGVEIHEELFARQRDLLVQGIETRGDTDAVFTRFKAPEVSFKFHASCRHTHPAVDAVLEVRRQTEGFAAGDVTRIRAHLYSGAYDRLRNIAPSSPWAAKFNLPFCLAQAAMRGELGLAAFTEDALADEEVRALMDRVELAVDPALDELYPTRWASWVEVELADGRSLTGRVETPKGDPENPLSAEELADKFRLLVEPRLGKEAADTLLRAARGVAGLSPVSKVFDIPRSER